MKTTRLFLQIIGTALLVFLISCKKDDISLTPEGTSNLLSQGTWKVSHFDDNGNNETSHFSGYNFSFHNNGSVSATGNNNSANGTWSTGSDDNAVKLVLQFGSNAPFDELNDDWRVVEQGSTQIHLEDVSGGNGGIHTLTFTKN